MDFQRMNGATGRRELLPPVERLRKLADRLPAGGRSRLRLASTRALRLRALLREADCRCRAGSEGEALARLCADSRRMETCLRMAQTERGARLPGRGEPRVLTLARCLLAGGEQRLDQAALLEAVAAFDDLRPLQMGEIEALPAALRIALCVELCDVAEEILRAAGDRRCAACWTEQGGRLPRRPSDAFLAHARRLCIDGEKGERLERLSARFRLDRAVERADGEEAKSCLRLENLMQLYLLLERLNWQECFDRLSSVEQELREDECYAAMDADSRAQLRACTAELARAFHVEEAAVARCALKLARERGRTVCFFLAEDEGRKMLRCAMGGGRRLRRCIPDPAGGKTAAVLAALTLLLCIFCCCAIGAPLLWINALPVAWGFAMQLSGWIVPRLVKPVSLLKLKLREVPDEARVLVTLPVLVSSVQRAEEMLEHMEALGCLERDRNIDYLLLGDFRDADAAQLPEDADILEALRRGVARLNAGAEREKYFCLMRGRSWRALDGRWMGEGRKRGALTALNRLLLARDGADEAFSAESRAAEELAGRYRYVLTLDADCFYLPGTVQKLAGAMLHPLNRKYALLQPCMQTALEADVNAYTHLACGIGGVDSYSVRVSDLWQDLNGRGSFVGKGIYDVRAFAAATDGVLPEEEILSHDLIEGILAGAGFVNDVCLYDGMPETPGGELMRRHRWMRGDWQLLRVIFSRMPICALDRLKMIGNLLRSLHAPAVLGLLVGGAWMDARGAFLLGLLALFMEAILAPGQEKIWRRAVLNLALLPASAACAGDAILRALWRLLVSRKKLLEWVPAADGTAACGRLRLHGRIAAILLLPGLLRPYWAPGVLALALLFWVGADWAEDLSKRKLDAPAGLSVGQRQLLHTIAAETWHFFASYVPEDGCGLPPDNVQFDPPAGIAPRTSPTNIGLYLMSCLAARELGLLEDGEMARRMSQTMDTLEELEKWNGQLYNWYDTRSLMPLKPRYVSAVDSGNLAAALLLCSRAVQGEMGLRMRSMAENMRLDALYDRERHLFFIGMDVESGELSRSHYDLYASEARLLSYAAMMLGQVPVKHWQRLGRPSAALKGGRALLSWSGTMFEYLMPELLLHSHPLSLAGQSRRAAVAAQMMLGRAQGRPWGVSESGHYAFDLQLNYQYRAFGLRELALSGEAAQHVTAPYAAALALCCAPRAAAENLREMRRMGWSNAFGMLEAADYQANGEPRLVRSCMAHHQGMILCAVCNALRENPLPVIFMRNPEARALRLLLQEKPCTAPRRVIRQVRTAGNAPRIRPLESFRRRLSPERTCETQLLHGAGVSVLVTGHGAAYIRRDRLLLNRFGGDLRSRHDGAYVHLLDLDCGQDFVFGNGGQAEFDAGSARFSCDLGKLHASLVLAVSPEEGVFYQQVTLENHGESVRELAVTGCMTVALAQEGDMRAHPAFQNLFVEAEEVDGGLRLHRRPREGGMHLPDLFYLCSEPAEAGADAERVIGRQGALGLPGGIAEDFSGGMGAVLNPCAALRCKLRVPAGACVKLHFALALAGDVQEAQLMRRSYASERAIRLAEAHDRALLRHCGLDGSLYRLANRTAALLADARLRPQCTAVQAAPVMPRESLWLAGVSGDLPILFCTLKAGEDGERLRILVRLHGFWRAMGVETDLVLADEGETGYRRLAYEMMENCIRASHLHALRGMPGGVFLPDAASAGLDALRRCAALCFDAGREIAPQLRHALEGLRQRPSEAWKPMQGLPVDVPEGLEYFNGCGGFAGEDYCIFLKPGSVPPAPWCNIMAAEHAGAVMTERGGGFIWQGNSRSGRITPFTNDILREDWGWMFYLLDERKKVWMRLLPGAVPMTEFAVRFAPNRCRWEGSCAGAAFSVEAVPTEGGAEFVLEVENTGRAAVQWQLAAAMNWLLGVDRTDAAILRCWHRGGSCFAAGSWGVGCFTADDPLARPGCSLHDLCAGGDLLSPRGFDELEHSRSGWTLRLPLHLAPGARRRVRLRICCGRDEGEARRLAADFGGGVPEKQRILRIETPDRGLNLLANGFLPAQVKLARVLARTGFYQPGGAYGFRDQLQDMLPLCYTEPERVRKHLLRCAGKQFEDGDVLHWWHEPCTGVRTRISDDLLFLPFVTAHYVSVTGDTPVLLEEIPFLKDVEIPEDGADVYAAMQPSEHTASLHVHCMRAFRRAARTGEHGLCRMGGGDWNDGMNRVGVRGRGESVWLSQFLAVCAEAYAGILPEGEDRAWLRKLGGRMRAAVEENGWDGGWYLRAYADDGSILGGKNSPCCRIDAISQAWAVLAGLDEKRCAAAMDAAWDQLVDEGHGIVRLLTPPFDGQGFDPGYIAAYPPGIRENGAQYTHAACWLLLALVRMGDGDRAWRLLKLLLPLHHADTREKAELYRVEPYVLAGDVYADGQHAGRGGWTWYTGSAAWLLMAVYALLGFEKRGNRVRLHALPGGWKRVSLTMEWGGSSYELVCARDEKEVTLDGEALDGWVELTDDGRRHRAVFPPRQGIFRDITGCTPN